MAPRKKTMKILQTWGVGRRRIWRASISRGWKWPWRDAWTGWSRHLGLTPSLCELSRPGARSAREPGRTVCPARRASRPRCSPRQIGRGRSSRCASPCSWWWWWYIYYGEVYVCMSVCHVFAYFFFFFSPPPPFLGGGELFLTVNFFLLQNFVWNLSWIFLNFFFEFFFNYLLNFFWNFLLEIFLKFFFWIFFLEFFFGFFFLIFLKIFRL